MVTKGITKKKRASSRRAGQKKEKAVAELDLGKVLTISQVADWREKLVGVFDLREPIVINGGDIEKIDSAGLQLLVALMKEADATGAKIEWRAASELLKQNASQLGLDGVLHLEA
jgi:anti-anti-sigma factor